MKSRQKKKKNRKTKLALPLLVPAKTSSQVLKKELELIMEPKNVELNSRWKKIHVDKLQLSLWRNELMNEKVKLVLENSKQR